MKKLSNFQWAAIGIVLGGLGGFLYWKEIGCLTGTCPLKSQWQTMVPYGMAMGYLASSFVQDLVKRH